MPVTCAEVKVLGPSDGLLLQKFHLAMQQTFDEDELDSLECMLSELDGSHPRCSMVCVVALGHTGEILGGALWEYFKSSKCFLYTYLVITEEGRGSGLGRVIADAQWRAVRQKEKEGLVVNAIFTEFHDPAQVEDPEADAMDPMKRVRMFQHMGARQVGSPAFPYFQPPLDREPGQVLADMPHAPFLIAEVVRSRTPRDETGAAYVPTRVMRDFISDYYLDCAGDDYEVDPYYQKMMAALEGKEVV